MSLPYQSLKYANPPIVEALVDFEFEPTGDWDWTLPGKLQAHARLKGFYEGKTKQQQIWHAQIKGGQGQLHGVSVNEVPGRLFLQNADGTRLLTIGPSVMSVNSLKPYEGWQSFRPRIESALEAYMELTGATRIVRVGVRYINRLHVTEEPVDLGRYLTVAPPPLPGIGCALVGHSSQTEYIVDAAHRLLMIHAVVRSPDGELDGILLDLDAVWHAADGIPAQDAMTRVDELHQSECAAFEAAITDTTRALFGGVDDAG